ncbi:MAG TPA: type IX secretion system membrane protein PorP/SprF [Bacteroidales bacterium]|nr:type IX secretion system membrane protein PorP/SprF [Bacteroidales bacterium]
MLYLWELKKGQIMKKLLFSALTIILLLPSVKAQQIPLYSQYMLNGFLLNPGMAGSVNYIPIRLTARQQWTGIDGAPSTQAISAHSSIMRQKMGVGGYIFNDKFGPISQTGLQLSYAYHLQLNREMKLGLGLSFKAFQLSLNESDLVVIDQGDPSVTGATESTFVPDADFGAYLYTKKYNVGLAVTQLVQYKIKLGDTQIESSNQTIRHYYLTGGYKFDINQDFMVEPSLLFKATERTPMQLDINAKVFYKKNYWLGFSYRTAQAAIVLIGFKVDKFILGYSFDYTFSNLKNYSTGSHEILIGYNLGEGANKGNSLI